MIDDRINPADIEVRPLCERRSYIDIEASAVDPDAPTPQPDETVQRVAQAMVRGRARGASRILAYGAHLVKNGGGPLVRRLIERGWVDCLVTQGAGIIHDWEFAFCGRSSESVRDNAPIGRFGTWDETGAAIHAALAEAAADDLGFGQAMGRAIARDRLPFARYSITHGAFEARVPLCVLPGIGYDIFACHPAFTPEAGANLGKAATIDFHRLCARVRNLTGGAYLCVGSAVMGPQVFEKAFSIANNLRAGAGEPMLRDHHVAVIDIQPAGNWDFSSDREPPSDHPAYYLRWCKTFARMTAPHPKAGPGGTLQYIQIDNCRFLAGLLASLPH